jgi:CheY-like chemotaxis protein
MPHTLVLAIGRDAVLLETRSQVLQAAGYTVIPERSLKKAVARFRDGDFDLVLLCHSIPTQDRERLTRLLREHTSRTPIVSVSASLSAHLIRSRTQHSEMIQRNSWAVSASC